MHFGAVFYDRREVIRMFLRLCRLRFVRTVFRCVLLTTYACLGAVVEKTDVLPFEKERQRAGEVQTIVLPLRR